MPSLITYPQVFEAGRSVSKHFFAMPKGNNFISRAMHDQNGHCKLANNMSSSTVVTVKEKTYTPEKYEGGDVQEDLDDGIHVTGSNLAKDGLHMVCDKLFCKTGVKENKRGKKKKEPG